LYDFIYELVMVYPRLRALVLLYWSGRIRHRKLRQAFMCSFGDSLCEQGPGRCSYFYDDGDDDDDDDVVNFIV
jgi:hypothetical protein